MTNERVQIIYLNGPSSSGKTALAKALQNAFEEPFLHIGIDKIIGWMPEKVNDWTGRQAPLGFSWKEGRDPSGHLIQELQMGPYAQKMGKIFQEVVLTIAKMSHHMVIDDVSFGKKQLDEWKEILKGFHVLWVGVSAPLRILEQREQKRNNRILGSARAQFYKVHENATYDLEIDTHHVNVSENVEKIKSLALSRAPVDTCKRQLKSKEPANILIRTAELKDAPSIIVAQREIAAEPGYFCSKPSELSEEVVEQAIQSHQGIFLVAEYAGTVVGHAFLELFTVQALRHVADLNIAVHLGWQRKGIGTKLLDSILEWARQSHVIEKIQLNVRASNTLAISLYKKMGFKEEGRLKNHIKIKDHYIDDIIMGLNLVENHNNFQSAEQHITIREMHEKDIDTLIKTFCFPWSSIEATRDKWAEYYKEQQQHIRTVYLLETQGAILGYASLLRQSHYPQFKESGIPEINDVWVSADHRGNGLGSKLIDYIEKAAREQGFKQIGLGVGLYKDYGSAQKLYIHLGYIPDGMGVTYKSQLVVPGDAHPVDDDLLIWLKKDLE